MVRSIKYLMAGNVAMFALAHLLLWLCGAGAAVWLGVQPEVWPYVWTPLTYMFTDLSAWNLLFNLLWLWLFGRMFMEVGTERQLLTAYACGGLGGAVGFIIAAQCGLCGGLLFGASAAALGVVTCAACRVPRMRLVLMFFGAVEFRWIAGIAVALSLLSFASGNAGGGFAHIGGALGGVAASQIVRRQMRFRLRRVSRKKTLDELLDKVKRSGYASLSKAERQQLIEYSNNL